MPHFIEIILYLISNDPQRPHRFFWFGVKTRAKLFYSLHHKDGLMTELSTIDYSQFSAVKSGVSEPLPVLEGERVVLMFGNFFEHGSYKSTPGYVGGCAIVITDGGHQVQCPLVCLLHEDDWERYSIED